MKNDLLIQQDVVAALDQESTINPGSIGVEVHHGVVKLAGRVSADAIREQSLRAAQRVPGVTNVIMDVDVDAAGVPPLSGINLPA